VTEPTLIASRYRVLRELGRGGMGVVYLVEHIHTGDQLALKLLLPQAGASPELVARFKREARAPAMIKSEHVVKITDADVAPELDGAPFLVMECLSGLDFDKHVETQGPLAPTEVVEIFRQVASALDRAHALGITHRDMKPENLFRHRRENGEHIVKLLDFGISKVAADPARDIATGSLTRTGAVMGTPLYMSPEQARGTTVGPPTDIWALGLIAYYLLTGDIYWRANTIPELMVAILADAMPPPSSRSPRGLPSAFDAWFAKSCDRVPEQRFRTVADQTAALASALGVANEAPPSLAALGPLESRPLPAAATLSAPASPTPGASTASPLSRTAGNTTASGSSRAVKVGVPLFLAVAAFGVGVALYVRGTQQSATEPPTAAITASTPGASVALPDPSAATPAVAPPPSSESSPPEAPSTRAISPADSSSAVKAALKTSPHFPSPKPQPAAPQVAPVEAPAAPHPVVAPAPSLGASAHSGATPATAQRPARFDPSMP
jgi:serine/threonine protein kinase